MTSAFESPDEVSTDQWTAHHVQLRESGLTVFDFLSAQSKAAGTVRVTTHVMTPDAKRRVISYADLTPGECLASLAQIYPASSWHEREAFELVGVTFDALPATFPLLVAAPSTPLRVDAALERRVSQPWPGMYEPGPPKRRQRQTPGNRPEWTSATQVSEGTRDAN